MLAEAEIISILHRLRRTIIATLLPFALLNALAAWLIHLPHDDPMLLLRWISWNILIIASTIGLRLLVFDPLRHIASTLQKLRSAYHRDAASSNMPMSVRGIASELSHFSAFAIECYRRHSQTAMELEQAHKTIAHYSKQQQLILVNTQREVRVQYQSVLTYANYLDERVMSHRADDSLRYDFDDVCESSFSLALMARALTMLHHPPSEHQQRLALSSLLQDTLLRLSPALDRRSMKLTSIGVDMSVCALGNQEVVMHAIWMMLLGIIRHAQDESTLRLRTLRSRDGSTALLSIVISELCPSTLTQTQRADYLARQLSNASPHMFADSIRDHAHVTLAGLLLANSSGIVHVEPLTATSCELSLSLPAAY